MIKFNIVTFRSPKSSNKPSFNVSCIRMLYLLTSEQQFHSHEAATRTIYWIKKK